MFALSLTLEGTSTRHLERTLQVSQARLTNLTPAWNRAADNLERHVELNWLSRGTLTRKRWPSLKRATRKARRRRWGYYRRPGTFGGVNEMLVWTGRFRRAFKKGSPDHIRTITPMSLHWGAAVHFSRGSGSLLPDARGRSINLRRRIPLKFRDTGERAHLIFRPIFEYIEEAWSGRAAA